MNNAIVGTFAVSLVYFNIRSSNTFKSKSIFFKKNSQQKIAYCDESYNYIRQLLF